MNQKMKAAVLHGIDDLRVEEVDMPVPGPDDVLVKVLACGVCGSDVPRCITTGTYHFPTIPGHEFGGVVAKLGDNVDPSYLNRRAAVIPLIPCRKCRSCEVGHFAQCEHYDFLGSRSDGGFAEYVKVPKENLVFVPDNVDDESMAFLEPASVGLHAVSNSGLKFGDTAAVIGLGAIGIFVAQWAKAFGASRVFAIDIDPGKIEIARQLGLADAVCSRDMDIVKHVREETGGKGADRVFEASGAGITLLQAIEMIGSEGCITMVGRPGREVSVPVKAFEKILRQQVNLKGSWSFEFMRFPHNPWEITLDAISRGLIKTAPVISHRLPLEKTYDAVRIMYDKSEFFSKILIKP